MMHNCDIDKIDCANIPETDLIVKEAKSTKNEFLNRKSGVQLFAHRFLLANPLLAIAIRHRFRFAVRLLVRRMSVGKKYGLKKYVRIFKRHPYKRADSNPL